MESGNLKLKINLKRQSVDTQEDQPSTPKFKQIRLLTPESFKVKKDRRKTKQDAVDELINLAVSESQHETIVKLEPEPESEFDQAIAALAENEAATTQEGNPNIETEENKDTKKTPKRKSKKGEANYEIQDPNKKAPQLATCRHCGEIVAKGSLHYHVKMSHPELVLRKCELCNVFQTDSLVGIKKHMQYCGRIGNHKCAWCPYNTDAIIKLQDHTLLKHNNIQYVEKIHIESLVAKILSMLPSSHTGAVESNSLANMYTGAVEFLNPETSASTQELRPEEFINEEKVENPFEDTEFDQIIREAIETRNVKQEHNYSREEQIQQMIEAVTHQKEIDDSDDIQVIKEVQPKKKSSAQRVRGIPDLPCLICRQKHKTRKCEFYSTTRLF